MPMRNCYTKASSQVGNALPELAAKAKESPMQLSLVMTVIGEDRPGLVNSVVLQAERTKERTGTDRRRSDRGRHVERAAARSGCYFNSRSDGLTPRLNLPAAKKLG